MIYITPDSKDMIQVESTGNKVDLLWTGNPADTILCEVKLTFL